MSEKESIVKNDFFAFILILPMFLLLFYISFTILWIFLIASGLIYITLRLVNNSEKAQIKFPYFYAIIILCVIMILMFLDYQYLFILGGFIAIITIIDLINKKKATKKEIILYLMTAFIMLLLGISLLNIQSNNIFPAYFTSGENSRSIEFTKYDQRSDDNFVNTYEGYTEDQDVYRSLLFVGIQTDQFEAEGIPNIDQANLSIYINVTEYIPNTEADFWNTKINLYLIYYDDYIRELILSERETGYDVLDRVIELQDTALYYDTNSSESEVYLDANYVRMGIYLLVVDFVILPNVNNEPLYSVWNVLSFDSNIGFNVSGGLNYLYVPNIHGYSWIVNSLADKSEAENFFDDLIGEDIFNLMILFFLVFFITLLVSIIVRNIQIIQIMNILLVCIFILGMFAVIATGMANVPFWLQVIAGGNSAKYIWAVIEAVKYILIMGSCLAIIFMLTSYISTAFSLTLSGIDVSKLKVDD